MDAVPCDIINNHIIPNLGPTDILSLLKAMPKLISSCANVMQHVLPSDVKQCMVWYYIDRNDPTKLERSIRHLKRIYKCKLECVIHSGFVSIMVKSEDLKTFMTGLQMSYKLYEHSLPIIQVNEDIIKPVVVFHQKIAIPNEYMNLFEQDLISLHDFATPISNHICTYLD